VKVTGKVVKEDLSGGVWFIVSDAGQRYALNGGEVGLLHEGLRATVEGRVEEQAAGIGMTGDPVLSVDSFEVL